MRLRNDRDGYISCTWTDPISKVETMTKLSWQQALSLRTAIDLLVSGEGMVRQVDMQDIPPIGDTWRDPEEGT